MPDETAMPKQIKDYFRKLDDNVKAAYKTANDARKKNLDPEPLVDIPLAKNMAERVEGLIREVAPQLVGTKMARRIYELEKTYGLLDWRVGLKIAEEVSKETFCKFDSKKEAMEVGIRVGFAYLTGGIVAAPLEGFIELKLKPTKDNQEYFSVCYAGPIRGAGGTAAATSVILADYVRSCMGYAKYDCTEDEVNRYATEVYDYHERVTNLQYLPSKEEVKFIAKNLPVEVNGDPTEQMEVSNYKDLPRVETNRIRGGVCLVLAEGICQKAIKLWKRVSVWGDEFGLEWNFLKEFLELQKKMKSNEKEEGKKDSKITPNHTFIADLPAGRPVLTYPMTNGGFRLRYGRTRTSGFSCAAISPLTMHMLNDYIAIGTQLKIERPGKAAAVTTCDTIEGPIVLMKDGCVERIESETEAIKKAKEVKEIIYLGDILINYGDFSENNHPLVPAGYNEEKYVQELERATVNLFGALDLEKLSSLVELHVEDLDKIIKKPHTTKISARAAIAISKKLKIPLHPQHTPFWSSLKKNEILMLMEWLRNAKIQIEDGTKKIIFQYMEPEKRVLEILGLPHKQVNKEFVVLEKNESEVFLVSLGIKNKSEIDEKLDIIKQLDSDKGLDIIQAISDTKIEDKAGTFIGARMGRPEKAKMRKLKGSPHILFPVSEEGGRLRSFQSALDVGKITSDISTYYCTKCNRETIYTSCEVCGKKSKKTYFCNTCGMVDTKQCSKHGPTRSFLRKDIDINHYFSQALKALNTKTYPDIIKGVRGTSNKDHIPENLVKGILRAKHDVNVNKDGTTRYDMTELPITHFKPKEIRTSIDKLKELGYSTDIFNKPLDNEDQIIELFPQDIILPGFSEISGESADEILLRVANFMDELLVKFYKLRPFYKLEKKEDLVGHLVLALAPHISAGIITRIIGFSNTQACFAHPLLHAALRRDCDGDECCVTLLLDALINFSRQFLPDKRGGRTMDSPLVLTSTLIPSEVDDMVFGLDVCWKYPLEFYEAAQKYLPTFEVKIEQLKDRLGTDKQYTSFGFTHNVSDINQGVCCSAYKTAPSMEEKLKGQLEIAEKIRAVNESAVARLVIEKHFLKDIKGNLRKYSSQQFRCVKCNEKYRRPPLSGKCNKCGSRILFTVTEGSVIKYLEPSISIAEKYNLPNYIMQTLELTKRRIEGVFGRDKERQEGLGKWF